MKKKVFMFSAAALFLGMTTAFSAVNPPSPPSHESHTRREPVDHVGPMPDMGCGLEYRRRIESTLPIECSYRELSR